MRILALETSETTGSVALLEEESLVAARSLDPKKRSAQSLAPAIRQILAESSWRPADVELVGLVNGPGSFTGLRIGAATAKVFAYAVGCPVAAVNTLSAIAAQSPLEAARISVVFDAQRGELFWGAFSRRDSGELCWSSESSPNDGTRIIAVESWLAGLTPGEVVTGPGLRKLISRLPGDVRAVDASLWVPRAETVGRLALAAYRAGESVRPFELGVRYYRRAAAEDLWDRRNPKSTRGERGV